MTKRTDIDSKEGKPTLLSSIRRAGIPYPANMSTRLSPEGKPIALTKGGFAAFRKNQDDRADDLYDCTFFSKKNSAIMMLRRKGGRSTSSMTKAEDIRKRAGETKRRNIPFYLDEGAVLGLIRRVAGEEYASRFRIRQRASESGMDEYDLYCEGGHVCFDATSGVSAAAAVHH